MQYSLKLLFLLSIFITIVSCNEEDERPSSQLDDVKQQQYYDAEILPSEFQRFYGTWKLERIEGGIAGLGRPVDFDYLEVKPFGIYAVVRQDMTLEYGRFEVHELDAGNSDGFQIDFIADKLDRQYPTFAKNSIVRFDGDSMYIGQPCCDTYLRFFVREDRDNN